MAKKIFFIIFVLAIIGAIYFITKDEPSQVYTNSEINQYKKQANEQLTDISMTYNVNIKESQITWFGSKIDGSSHEGTVAISSGQIGLDDKGDFLSAEFEVDMNTIAENGSGAVIKHLKSDDFFAVETYPKAGLKITRLEKLSDNEYNVYGDLTIKGITNGVVFPATVIIENDKVTAQAEFDIDRTKWDIKYGSGQFFKELADKAIKDEINFKVNIIAAK